jgi:hypothetical protein
MKVENKSVEVEEEKEKEETIPWKKSEYEKYSASRNGYLTFSDFVAEKADKNTMIFFPSSSEEGMYTGMSVRPLSYASIAGYYPDIYLYRKFSKSDLENLARDTKSVLSEGSYEKRTFVFIKFKNRFALKKVFKEVKE